MKHLNKIALVLIIGIIAYLIVKEVSVNKSKIGVIEMEKLVYEFQGMKDATRHYEKKMENWNNQSDSLEEKLQSLYQEIQLDSINRDDEKLKIDLQKFNYLQKSYYEYGQKIGKKAKAEDQDMTIGILNQLKGFMADFAKENEYDLIISNTQMQNVGYVAQQNDVTEQVLIFANKKYTGE
jgi:Skp family chaperone for outer membrane proteins